MAHRAARQLPAPPTRLIGRAAELSNLVATITAMEARLVTVTCPGGCGKTRLALEASALLVPRFSEGAV
jgi:hypothetical protein